MAIIIAWACVWPAVSASLTSRPALTFGAGASSVPVAQASSASVLAKALAPGGSGITFQVVQTSEVHARAGGSLIPVLDPRDPSKAASYADSVPSVSMVESGIATPDGFYAELMDGPSPGASPDWAGKPRYRALATGGKVYRDDGSGWYATDSPPGIGLDPASVRRLAGLVGNAASPADAGVDPANPSLRLVAASASSADAPGLVASDGAAFTRLSGRATFALDPDGRVVRIHQIALNTNMTEFDLVVTTDIYISYGAGALPAASPALARAQAAAQP